VLYWMSRDQRVSDNWALLHAQKIAFSKKAPLAVVFCLVPDFLGATIRHYGFMLKGLEEAEKALERKGIPFFVLKGDPAARIGSFVKKHSVSSVVTDFDPLKIKRKWKKSLAGKINVPFYEVDAHNIVPCWVASGKQEYGAYTIRGKINGRLGEYLEGFPPLKKHPHRWKGGKPGTDWKKLIAALEVDRSVKEVPRVVPGEAAAKRKLRKFLEKGLGGFDGERNDPNLEGQSGLSPYLHFGQISAQRAALEVKKSGASRKNKEAFLEELIVRRELSDNFCFYNRHYDSFRGFPEWAKKTLNEHGADKREYLYTRGELEKAKTHDDLWNAAQTEMVKTGRMHGYMRMYWAKKVLEWTRSAAAAQKICIYLNDRYELDGRDPNGYAGIAWSIGGVHDRAWNERKVFGKIRFMSYNGCRSKFDVKAYIDKVKNEKSG